MSTSAHSGECRVGSPLLVPLIAAMFLGCAGEQLDHGGSGRESALSLSGETTIGLTKVRPEEATNAVLHNPDMGWVVYENYPLDQQPNGSSTLLSLPKEDFPVVDAVALMFTWQDLEKHQGEYDFSKVDYAYDYWAKRGKEIQLRMSTASLMYWANHDAGKGVPAYVREKMAESEKQTRQMDGVPYNVEDPRNAFYRERLSAFLQAVAEHFSGKRQLTLIDLRGFGAWGEWHSGFQFKTVDDRRAALIDVIEDWCRALPKHRLALSYSYDPDGPKELYAGPNSKFDERFTTNYLDFLRYSAFDWALTKTNVTWRRDGCGSAVHSNERKLNEEAFRTGRGPMFSEFVDGYIRASKGGTNWVSWFVEDALSLHPNYINLLGWQGHDALAFIRERTDLIEHGLRQMGYRFVPTNVTYPQVISGNDPCHVTIEWVNRGVGRALRDYELRFRLVAADGTVASETQAGTLATSQWMAGQTYRVSKHVRFRAVVPGDYRLCLGLRDPRSGKTISLPLIKGARDNFYELGSIRVAAKR